MRPRLCRLAGRVRLAATLLFALIAWPSHGMDMPKLSHERPRAVPSNSPEWQARMVALFEEGVLFDEAKRPRGINKWQRPIDLSIRGDAADDFAPFIEDVAIELSDIIGLPIELYVNKNWAGNIDIYITYWKNYWPFFIQATDPSVKVFTCAATPWSLHGLFRRSQIKINAGVIDAGTARACLVEELVQSLGLLGEVTSETDTILNDDIGYQGIGAIDELMLRVLYDQRMTAGLPNNEAILLARNLIAEQLAASGGAAR